MHTQEAIYFDIEVFKPHSVTGLIIPRLFRLLFHMVSPNSNIYYNKYLNYSLVDSLCVLRLFCLDTCRSSLPSPANPNNSILNKRMAHFPIVAVSRPRFVPTESTMERIMCSIANYLKCCYAKRRGSVGFVILSDKSLSIS